jgi:galactokinase
MSLLLQKFKSTLIDIYGNDVNIFQQKYDRYQDLINRFQKHFKEEDLHLFSTPGRTEIGGNHTDHNHGRVLAASVNLDSIAVAARNNLNTVTMFSDGYNEPFVVDLENIEIQEQEKGTTSALIRGIAAKLKNQDFKIGGFNAYINSDILPGSGLSSSASIEVLIGKIFSVFFNADRVPPEDIAKIGQYAENIYFGKPCGLMDQMTCSVGGIITIDFEDPNAPVVKKVNFDFNKRNYSLLVVDTGGNHADLTDDYASVPNEMKSVAAQLGVNVCRDMNIDELIIKIPQIRTSLGDRAILRAMHFLQENNRVLEQVNALENNNFNQFLDLITASGNSSFKWLQNIYTTKNIREQGVSLALSLTENYMEGIHEGACRVHGGGFAGTIQVFLPKTHVEKYIKIMEPVFGKKSVLALQIRPYGAVHINKEIQ